MVVEEFAVEMSVGLAFGLAGGALLVPVMRRVSLPSEGLYPLRTLAGAGLDLRRDRRSLGGSGFLAVFVAGVLIGDARAPFKAEIERFHGTLASLAEIAVFVALGDHARRDRSGHGPRCCGRASCSRSCSRSSRARSRSRRCCTTRASARGERIFLMWGGLKGAVPILLGALAVLSTVDDARRTSTS